MTDAGPHLPAALKWACSAYVGVLVPVYWHAYGVANFISFCDIALFLALAGLWRENALLLSMALVATLVVDLLWLADVARGLAGLRHGPLTAYLFDPQRSLGVRLLSLFHLWLPPVLVGALWRLGYDRRALPAWAGVAVAAMIVSYLWLPPPAIDPGGAKVNVNWVHGLAAERPQAWMPPQHWLGLEFCALFVLCWWPAHLLGGTVLRRGD